MNSIARKSIGNVNFNAGFSPKRYAMPPALTAVSVAAVLLLSACGSTGPAKSSSSAATSTSSATIGNSNPTLNQQQLAAIVTSPNRTAADRSNDAQRKPQLVLAFIGIKPGMVALDLSAAGGYTTELLARAVGPNGRVYGQSPPPRDANSPPQQTATPEGNSMPSARPAASMPAAAPAVRLTSPQALAARAASNPALSNIIPVVRNFDDPVPPELANGGLDLVTLMFNYHDLGHWDVDRAQMNKRLFAALKPGGMYVISDHAGRDGTGISESGTLHRIEEAFLRREVEAAGFKQVDEGYFLRNPADPRDKNTPEPPQPKDDFIVKFVRP
jgi:predicted methyltransferase